MKKIFVLALLTFQFTAFSAVVRVTSTLDSGSESLRDAVDNLANNGDTILIDVKGDIVLNSAILFNSFNNLTIIGPSAKHCLVKANAAYTDTSLFKISNSSNIVFKEFGFIGIGSNNVRGAQVSNASTNIKFERILFKDLDVSGVGILNQNHGAGIWVKSSANIEVLACSFISNKAQNGGAIFFGNASSGIIRNSTFFENEATGQAGAICLGDNVNVELTHNTIIGNTSISLPAAYFPGNIGSVTTLKGNAISNNTSTGGTFQFTPSIGLYVSTGGNKYKLNTGEAPATAWLNGVGDVNNTTLDFKLRSTILTDGFGLMYFTIVDATSALVNSVTLPSTLTKDCRNAPRALKSTNVSLNNPDAGACEYTPLRVTNPSNLASTANTLPWALDAPQNFNALNYIEFDFATTPMTINPSTSVPLVLDATYIIDGYSQNGSAVPGPALMGNSGVTPANILINIENSTTVSFGFNVSITGSNSRISGLRIIGFTQGGINVSGNNCVIDGNEIGINSSNTSVPNGMFGIQVNSNYCRIGGIFHYERNVISGNGTSGGSNPEIAIISGADSNEILGNIIGLRRDGNDIFNGTSGYYGIHDAGKSTRIGKVGAGNVISNKTEGLRSDGTTTSIISANIIGLDYDGIVAKGNGTGIFITGNCSSMAIGLPILGGGNIIAGNTVSNLQIYSSNGVNVQNNFIGVDITGNTSPSNSIYGIYFGDPNAHNILIGGTNANSRNIISGNQNGITFVDNGNGIQILNNYIGTDVSGNNSLPNQQIGIFLTSPNTAGFVQIGLPGAGNVISGITNNFGAGIYMDEGANHKIQGNFIGTTSNGLSNLNNTVGIFIALGNDVAIGGAYSGSLGNFISGNTTYGIHIADGSNNSIQGNVIGLNAPQSASIPNGIAGIRVSNADNTMIGGAAFFQNVIAAHTTNFSSGILLNGDGLNTQISGNLIGQNEIASAAPGNYYGIFIDESHSAVIGNAEPNFIVASTDAGIFCSSNSAVTVSGNVIGRNHLGGIAGCANNHGIYIEQANASISGVNPNVIVNSTNHGIFVNGELADNVIIDGNYIGTDQTGIVGQPNLGDGIHVVDADAGVIGLVNGNIICGNTLSGILLTGTVDGYVIQKNSISDFMNTGLTNGRGVYLTGGVVNNFIGSSYGVSGDNVIGNSINEGILIENTGVNMISGNDIGNDGFNAKPNAIGISVVNTNGTLIGGTINTKNVVSGNSTTGILLTDAPNTVIQSNLIGTNTTGNGPIPNVDGIVINGNSTGTFIGGSNDITFANTISSNTNIGLRISSSDITVQRNYIGTTEGGLGPMSFQKYGITLESGAQTCLIGGDKNTEGNIIASNEIAGVQIVDGSNDVYGNIFGANASYTLIGTQPVGIFLTSTSCSINNIGKENSGGFVFANTFLNHSIAGIEIENGANTNVISGNYIGCDEFNNTTNTQNSGILITATAGIDNKIGNDIVLGHNVISGNANGIKIEGGVHTFIYNNRIGLSVNGINIIGNTQNGIWLLNGGFNTIGGPALKANVIGGNIQNGILIEGLNAINNEIVGNIIGANIDQSAIAPNGVGIKISGNASNNEIGQTGTQNGNIIGGNLMSGIVIDNASSNSVFNNEVGLNFSNKHGIIIQNGSSSNIIGGTPAERNIISNNDSLGVAIVNADLNFVSGNFIGSNSIGNSAMPNLIGVGIFDGDFNEVGNQNHFNLISSNSDAAVVIENGNSNVLKNNFVGTDTSGNAVYPGSSNGLGLVVKNSNSNQIGGNNTIDEENIICNNNGPGIYFENADLNDVYGNKIGINKSGTSYLPNSAEGILLRQGSDNNTIGSSGTGLSNAIAANSKGIFLKNSNDNTIESNFIGNNLDGTGNLSGTNNQVIGLHIDSASTNNQIINSNIIAGNTSYGVVISAKNSNANEVKGNYFGLETDGVTGLPNSIANMVITDSAKFNLIGGQTAADRNYFGGNCQFMVYINEVADTNYIKGNYINLGSDASTTYTCINGVAIESNSSGNFIGGGLPGEGNTIVATTSDAIFLSLSNKTKILGNRIGIKPDSSPGNVGGDGVKFFNADNTWMGAYVPGSDSMNVITNCNRGVSVMSNLGDSYGNVIGGNSIYNNSGLGIDLNGDNLVEPIDTVNIFGNNGGIDMPEIVSAWNCGGGSTTHIGFKFFASNTLTYHIEFYSNTDLDPSLYGEGQNYLGDFLFIPGSPHDTIMIDLGQTLSTGTVLTATITGFLGNTSEFSKQFSVTDAPIVGPVAITNETCLGADNGWFEVNAVEAYKFSYNGGLTWIYSTDVYTDSLPTNTYTILAEYLNGCQQSTNVILNDGLPLPFNYSVVPDTCDLNLGSILLDTIVTNSNGGSGNYEYSFTNGIDYNTSIDTVNIIAGTYLVGLFDATFGCYSNIESIVVNEINDVVDESFVFDDFCPSAIPIPSSVATSGGVFSFGSASSATINSTTGLISGAVEGTIYDVVYTVGICNEDDTISVLAIVQDDPTFTFDTFCVGTSQNIVVTGLIGGTFSFDPMPTDGASINSSTGVITTVGGTYTIEYLTNGTCPDSSTVNVVAYSQPAKPSMVVVDSIYCFGDTFAPVDYSAGINTPNWTIGSSSSTVLSTNSSFTPSGLNYGNNFIYLYVSDGNNCNSLADSVNYYISDLTSATAGPDVQTCQGSKIQLQASGGDSYLWTPGDYLDDNQIANPVAYIRAPVDFEVLITDTYGCQKTDTLKVTLLSADECYVESFNAFSPNNDGVNDTWWIDGIEGYPVNTVTIFNRWGDVVIKLENYDNLNVIWDGKNKFGNDVNDGTFYYVIDVEGDQSQAGWIQVVR